MLSGAMKRLIAALLFAPLPLLAQGAQDVKYQLPPKEITEVVDAPVTPAGVLSPDGKWLLLLQPPSLLTIADLSQPELKLAGIRFNPETHDQTRSFYVTSLTLVPVAGGGAPRAIGGLPTAPRMRSVTWSPDSSKIAFALSTPGGVELWVADAATAGARRIGNVLLNQMLPRRPFEWMPDSKSLLARVVPTDRGPAPEPTRTPSGPAVQESRARKAPARTYEDMIRTEADAALFEHHMQASLVRVPLDGQATTVLPAAMIIRATPSPDGRFILAETVHRPFSYTVPMERFPRRIEIVSAAGQVVRQIADLPLADQIPIDFDAVRTGARELEWRADKPATLFWVEALDGGNPRNDVPFRDRLLTLAEPFSGEGAKLADTPLRYDGITWGSDDFALVSSARFKDRKTQTWRIRPAHSDAAAQIVIDRSFEDRYSDPGDPLTTTNASGRQVLRFADSHTIYLVGEGASPEGVRPFIDKFDVDAKKATRLFRSEAPYYEQPLELIGDQILTRRESVSEAPNWFLRPLRTKTAPRALTSLPNP